MIVLALANLGTSFASAILAKDMTTSNGQLVDKKTKEALATATAVETYTVGDNDGENARILAECTNTTIADCESTLASVTTMSSMKALALLKNCYENKIVQLRLTSGNTVETRTVCGGPSYCSGSSYTVVQGTATSGELCIPGSTEKLGVTQVDFATYELSQNLFAPISISSSNLEAPTLISASPTTSTPTSARPTTSTPTSARPTTSTPTSARPTTLPTSVRPALSLEPDKSMNLTFIGSGVSGNVFKEPQSIGPKVIKAQGVDINGLNDNFFFFKQTINSNSYLSKRFEIEMYTENGFDDGEWSKGWTKSMLVFRCLLSAPLSKSSF